MFVEWNGHEFKSDLKIVKLRDNDYSFEYNGELQLRCAFMDNTLFIIKKNTECVELRLTKLTKCIIRHYHVLHCVWSIKGIHQGVYLLNENGYRVSC